MYSGEYDPCDVTLSVYPHWASLKNMPDHGGNRTYDLWNTSPMQNISISFLAKELLKEGSKGADVNEGRFVLNIDVLFAL
jgi:hypothetical protein